MTPITGLSKGNYVYIILIILVMLTTYYSFKKSLSQAGPGQQQGQTKSMLTMMLVMIFVASFSLPTAIALYWIVTNAFIIVQTFIFEKMSKKDEKKDEKKVNTKKKISIKEKSEKRRGN